MAKTILLVLSLVAGFAITYFFADRMSESTVYGAFGDPIKLDESTEKLGMTLFAFTMTLVGVYLGAAYRYLQVLKANGETTASFFKVTIAVFNSIDFLLGLFASPIAFGVIWQSINGISILGITAIALQNGFSIHAIMDGITNRN